MKELKYVSNPQAEMSVIGAMILSGNACESGIVDLNELDFTEKPLRIIFAAIKRLVIKNIRVDLVTLNTELGDDLQLIGGSAYLTNLLSIVPSASNYPYYAEYVKGCTKIRELQTYFSNSLENIRTRFNECTPSGLIEEIEQGFDNIAMSNSINKTVNMKTAVSEASERIEKSIALGGEISGISTGFKYLDDALGGLQGGQSIVLGARTSIGKTALAICLTINFQVPVLYISLEMVTSELTLRMLSLLSGIPFSILRRPKFLKQEYIEKLEIAKQELINKKIEISDKTGQNIWQIKTTARRLKRNKGLGVIIIDHLHLIKGDNPKDNRVMELKRITNGIKELAKELDVPIISLAQLSRSNDKENRPPKISDIRDGGSIEEDADIIILLHRENKEKAEISRTQLLIEKHRNGAPCEIIYEFHGKTMKYIEIERHQNF